LSPMEWDLDDIVESIATITARGAAGVLQKTLADREALGESVMTRTNPPGCKATRGSDD